MKPEQFIREFGVEKAREVVATEADTFTFIFNDGVRSRHKSVSVQPLKRLVDSLDLLKYLGGYDRTKARLQMARKNGTTFGIDHLRWQQACRDHESIYGGGDEHNRISIK